MITVRRRGFIMKTIPWRLDWIVALFIMTTAAIFGYSYALHDFGSLNYPPIRSGSDQLDYNAMAYAFMKTTIPGIYVTQEYVAPFIDFSENPFGNYTEGDKNHLERVLARAGRYSEEVRPYAYRPVLYSMLLGTVYKIFGYDFSAARCLNIALFVICALLLYALCRKYSNMMMSISAATAFMTMPVVAKRMYTFGLEVPLTFVALLFLYLLVTAIRRRFDFASLLAVGASAGLLVLTKQMLVIIISLFWLFLGVYFLLRFSKLWRNYFAGTCVLLLLVLPWMSYNVAVTGDVSLPLGTSGWHDMPSVYSASYLNGENQYNVRERIFSQYALEHGVDIRTGKERAIYGRKIFWETFPSSLDFHVDLMLHKLSVEFRAGELEWAIRIVALLAVLILSVTRRLNIEHVSMLVFAALHLVVVALTFGTGGRNIMAIFPIALVFSAIGLESALDFSRRAALNFSRRAGWPARAPWMK